MAENEPVAPLPTLSPEVQHAALELFGGFVEALGGAGGLQKSSFDPEPHEEPKAWWLEPNSMLDSFGMGYRANPSTLTFEMLHAAAREPINAAVVRTRSTQISTFSRPQRNKYSVGFEVRLRGRESARRKQFSPSEKDRALYIERHLLNTGLDYNVDRDSFDTFIKRFIYDSLVLDQGCFEKTRTRGGDPHAFYAVPSDTMRIAEVDKSAPSGRPLEEEELRRKVRYVQIMDARRWKDFTADEMAFCVRNPRTSTRVYRYGFPEIELLITTITSLLWATEYNRRLFSQGSTIRAIINLQGKIPPKILEDLKKQWHAQLAGVQNAWKTPVVNSDGMQVFPLQWNNREMEFQAWLEFNTKLSCFPPEQRVVMADGSMRRIDRIKPGDMVQSHVGRARRVKNIQIKKHDGDMVAVKAAGCFIRATREHPFYAASSRINGHMLREFDDPAWVKAEDLVEGQDYLMVPKPRPSPTQLSSTRIDLAKHVDCLVKEDKVHLDHARALEHDRYLELTPDNAFLLGLYAAEGYSSQYRSTFAFAASETAYGEAVRRFANSNGLTILDVTQRPTSLVLSWSSGLLARVFRKIFGPKAIKRHVPQEILTASLVIQRHFLSGLIGGDGSVYRSSRAITVSFCTASRRLAEQVQQMLLLQGIYAGRYEQRRKSGFKPGARSFDLRIEGAQLEKMAGWLIGEKGDKLRAWLADLEATGQGGGLKQKIYETPSYFALPIVETWIESYDGEVYNMEVEEEHTYCVERVAVHNCAIWQIDPSEINFDLRGSSQQQPLFMSSNEAQQKVSKDRGLTPLLRFVEDSLNRHVVWAIDDRFELAFVGLDAKTEEQATQLRLQQGQSHLTLNEVRALEDLDPVEHGDVVLNPVFTSVLQLAAAEKAAAQQGAGGGGGGAPGASPDAPPPTEEDQAFLADPGEEERRGAARVVEFLGAKNDEKGTGPNPENESSLFREDWTSSVRSSVAEGDLKKSERRYEVLDLD